MVMDVVQRSLSAPNVTRRRRGGSGGGTKKNRQNIVDGYYVRRHRRFHKRRRRRHTVARHRTNENIGHSSLFRYFVVPGRVPSEKRRHRIMMIIVCSSYVYRHSAECQLKKSVVQSLSLSLASSSSLLAWKQIFHFHEQRYVCVSAWSLFICSHVLGHGIRFSNKRNEWNCANVIP